ncbi:hypothetical protein IAR50_003973 [Cryptococcus sp. DSM 104548]
MASLSSPSSAFSRKRRAPSPLGSEKRRRPNLANGFSSLSLHGAAPARSPPPDDTTDDGLGPSNYPKSNDLKVEVLPEASSQQDTYAPSHHHHSHLHHWSRPSYGAYGRPAPSSSSNSPSSSGDETCDSEATTRHFSRPRRYAGAAQQADEVVQPDANDIVTGQDLGVEDVTGVPPSLRARRPREDDCVDGPAEKRRRSDMDIDMDANPEPDLGDSQSVKDKMRKRKTVWHEPEKDRIVITSLSDSDSRSSRSPSPEFDLAEGQGRLSQPGEHGFTLSPSLLTHLMKARRDYDFQVPLSELLKNNERGLTVYRPLGISPGKWRDDIVKTWEEAQADADAARFEEIDDEEVPQYVPEGMDVEQEAAQPWSNSWTAQEEAPSTNDGDVDMAMDVE